LEGRVLVTARRFTELDVTGEVLDAPDQVEQLPRQISAPELVEDATQVTPMIGRPLPEASELVRPTPDLFEEAIREAPREEERRSGWSGLLLPARFPYAQPHAVRSGLGDNSAVGQHQQRSTVHDSTSGNRLREAPPSGLATLGVDRHGQPVF